MKDPWGFVAGLAWLLGPYLVVGLAWLVAWKMLAPDHRWRANHFFFGCLLIHSGLSMALHGDRSGDLAWVNPFSRSLVTFYAAHSITQSFAVMKPEEGWHFPRFGVRAVLIFTTILALQLGLQRLIAG
ncbi:hypothetical protein Mal64_13210 [Pseudobythopirellula maris]|uniref:Uncharacterized protein n=1 Tax=Pseudobythopirellula maris TaxID=2527991 RepID=A0A5C5ZTR2_9BACT|nr:hypothetical protein [Pseudobythopirellula maris]TWT90922.1 hypothetical protein Mal64_13210 [Pseudobythopirellula maris]